jgi:hypothetical protein
VLKNRETNTELFVLNFQLLPTEQAKKEGVQSPEVQVEKVHGGKEEQTTGGDDDELD